MTSNRLRKQIVWVPVVVREIWEPSGTVIFHPYKESWKGLTRVSQPLRFRPRGFFIPHQSARQLQAERAALVELELEFYDGGDPYYTQEVM